MYKEIIQVKTVTEIEIFFLKKPVDKLFTRKELQSVEEKHKIKSLGARYLIKLSVMEFLGMEDEFLEMEIMNEKKGKPVVVFTKKLKEYMAKKKIGNVHISISHSRNFISSLVVIEQYV